MDNNEKPKPMAYAEYHALLRMPITRGILATSNWGGKSIAGNGERPALPILGRDQHTVVGSRARRLSDGANGL